LPAGVTPGLIALRPDSSGGRGNDACSSAGNASFVATLRPDTLLAPNAAICEHPTLDSRNRGSQQREQAISAQRDQIGPMQLIA
jgi:hypothetical protein